MSGHYRVMAVYTRPHPLDPLTLKEPIDKAREYGPGAHIRISPKTRHALMAVATTSPESSWPPWLGRWLGSPGVPVVLHDEVPDDEWQVAVWQIGVEE